MIAFAFRVEEKALKGRKVDGCHGGLQAMLDQLEGLGSSKFQPR